MGNYSEWKMTDDQLYNDERMLINGKLEHWLFNRHWDFGIETLQAIHSSFRLGH